MCEDLLSSESESESKRPKYAQKYKMEWEVNRPWLKNESGSAYCRLCKKILDNNLTNLNRHVASKSHNKKENEAKNQTFLPGLVSRQLQKETEMNSVLKKEVALVMYCVSHYLPFTTMDTLPELFNTLAESKDKKDVIKCSSKKAAELVNTISIFSRDLITEKLKNTKFSLIIDESTDISCKKCLVLVVRYRDKDVVKDEFFGLLELEDSTAKSISNAVKSYLAELKIPGKNLIGLGTDNAAVMKGELHGVKRQLEVLNPNLFYLGCTCHSLNLCSKAASKQMPCEIEALIKKIFNFFTHSSKRQSDFKQLQKHFDVSEHKILNISSTRWLSTQAAVDRVLEQWTALQHYFLLLNFEEKRENNIVTIVGELNDVNKCYLLFLSYFLQIVNKINKIFQYEKTMIHCLFPLIEEFFKTILINFIKKQYVSIDVDYKNLEFQRPITSVYCGLGFETEESNLSDEAVIAIKKNILNFYITFCDQIKQRFSFEDREMFLLQYIDPKKIQEGDLQSVSKIAKAFPFNECSIEVLNEEWRSFINVDISNINKEDVVDFWHSILDKTNILEELMFKNLADYMLNLCVLPHSSAAAERKFSEMNLIKTKIRNKLNVNTVNSLMFAACLIQDKKSVFLPPLALIQFLKKYKFVDGKYILI